MIIIAKLIKNGMKNIEIMKLLKMNKDRFYERKRRIRKQGGIDRIASSKFDFTNHPDQKYFTEIAA